MDLETIGAGGGTGALVAAVVMLSKMLYDQRASKRAPSSSPPPPTSLIERNATAHERGNALLEELVVLAKEQLSEIRGTRHKLGDGLQAVHEAVSQDLAASEDRTERRLDRLGQDLREIRQRMPSTAGGE